MSAQAPYTAAATGSGGHPRAPRHSPYLPLLLLLIAFVGWSALQGYQLLAERHALAAMIEQQTAPLAQAAKIRAAANSLASKTQVLADNGNANAETVVAELKRRGITINPNAAPEPPPG
jgi:hypothetical protein